MVVLACQSIFLYLKFKDFPKCFKLRIQALGSPKKIYIKVEAHWTFHLLQYIINV